MNTCELENPSKTRARNVVRPPLNTAGPIVRRASSVLTVLPPKHGEYYQEQESRLGLTTGNKESMSNMNRVVDTQPNGKNDIDTGDNIDGDVPEVEESDYVDQRKNDSQKDHQTYSEVGK